MTRVISHTPPRTRTGTQTKVWVFVNWRRTTPQVRLFGREIESRVGWSTVAVMTARSCFRFGCGPIVEALLGAADDELLQGHGGAVEIGFGDEFVIDCAEPTEHGHRGCPAQRLPMDDCAAGDEAGDRIGVTDDVDGAIPDLLGGFVDDDLSAIDDDDVLD